MAITTEFLGANSKNDSVASLTDGNEHFWRIPDGKAFIIQSNGSGSAAVKVSANPATPTSFSNMVTTDISSFTADNIQRIEPGIKWVGVDIASGTWTIYISVV